MVFALRKFRTQVLGQRFTVCTDHRSLSFLFSTLELNATLQRWLEEIQDYMPFDVIHVPGESNFLADLASRVEGEPDNDAELKVATVNAVRLSRSDDKDWKSIASEVHQQGHFGKATLRMRLLLDEGAPNTKETTKIIDEIVDGCRTCQKFKETRTMFHPLHLSVAY